jgi:threonine aldolase
MDSGIVDLRSDTVTRPTTEMRRAMADAEVGDDDYGEDPTVRALEETYAERVGKQRALFVPSGTMANQLALRVLCRPGGLVVAGRRQHIVIYEYGGAAQNAGAQFHLVDDSDGTIDPACVSWAIEAAEHHQPQVQMVCIENTHMPAGGVPWGLDELDVLSAAASGVALHMDGARLFNAEVAMGVSAERLAACATTVMSCMSKGLCAPVGSLLAGSDEIVEVARIERKRLGGGMRQAGVVAAAGLVSLRTMVERLAEDHERARRLAEAVFERWGVATLDPAAVRTNIVVFEHRDPERLLDHLRAQGVLAGTIAPGVCRLVTHHDVDDEGIERAMKAVAGAP